MKHNIAIRARKVCTYRPAWYAIFFYGEYLYCYWV